MTDIKTLFIQVGIYGISSILGRLANYLLVPLYTRVFLPHEAAIYIEMYAYMAFLIIMLTYGMETAFFRKYQNTDHNKKDIIFSTAFFSILFTSTLFVTICSIISPYLSEILRYSENPEYVIYSALILGFDALSAIPFARLRAENKAVIFAIIKLINIFTNIALNLLFILFIPFQYRSVDNYYLKILFSIVTDGTPQVNAIFVANLVSSALTFFILILTIRKVRWKFNFSIWRWMIGYGAPLLFLGLAGITIETLDRILLKYLLPGDIAMHAVGIYGMCFKMAVFISLYIQAFRYASDPFYFAKASDKNAPSIYATIMNYFVIIAFLIFLIIILFIDYVKFFVGSQYHEGIKVVPILLISHILLGIYYNLSIWYKIIDRTIFGAYISFIGVICSVVLNIILIPKFGYVGSAWANFFSYFSMVIFSYLLGQKYYKIPYKISRILLYAIVAILLFFVSKNIIFHHEVYKIVFSTFLIFVYILIVAFNEKELRMIIIKKA